MKIAIKNPAPLGPDLERWGDYHFGRSLQFALEARGIVVVQHFWPEWDRDDGEDVVLYLRGKHPARKRPGKLSVMWIISHPSAVSRRELDGMDLVYSASETLLEALRGWTATPLELMRQCTDPRFFNDVGAVGSSHREGVLFVANSRGVRRDMMRWALETGLLPTLIGRHWEGVGLGALVSRQYVDNRELPGLYRTARIGLNDHWMDMRHYGIVSNRIFDCLACGLPVVTDGFPELERVCGQGVQVVDGPQSYWDAIWASRTRYGQLLEDTARAWERIGADATFKRRADQIATQLERLPANGSRCNAGTASAVHSSGSLRWTRRMVARAVEQARIMGRTARPRILHLCPTHESSAYICGRDDVQSFSAGPGEGPWLLPIDAGLPGSFSAKFDAILIEDADLWDRVDDRDRLLLELVGRLRSEGLLCVYEPDRIGPVLEAGLVTGSPGRPGVMVRRRNPAGDPAHA